MNPVETIQAMAARMTPRERRLFGVLGAALAIFLAAGAWFAASSYVSLLEEDIRTIRDAMVEIRRMAPSYLEVAAARAETERLIRENKSLSIRVAANEILKKKELADEVPGATGTTMSDVVSFEGKTSETPVGVGKKKKGKAKVFASGVIQVEQKLEFREVPWVNLFDFLDDVSRGKDLLFVTRLDIARKFNQMTHVRAEVVLATFQFQEETATPAADSKKGGR